MKSKKFFLSVQGVLVLLFLVSCSGSSDRVRLGEMKDLKDSASFSLGYLNGLNAAADNDAPVNADLYARGFKQAYLQDTSEVWDVNTMRDIVMEYAHRTQMAMREKSFEAAKPDIERAEKFLVENSLKDGVQTTQSGLQYKVEKQGKVRKPLKNNGERVILQYTEYELYEENKM
ncbi:MAG: FKBP-type peptidyl-prolyl cis-trans isomerase N-terminal domain-containing protein, partial [Bacteroidales bacterium]|nr:FKBP-type peptidyl-prolyl cis-trans isomerase N-terminal domain-containing protein [Bacteroidales bacterium]